MLIEKSRLLSFCQDLFQAAGICAPDAAMLSEVLVLTDMRGIASHGVVRSASYLDCLHSGGIKAVQEPEILAEGPGFCRMSAAGGLGIPASCKAVRKLIALVQHSPLAIVTLNHSDHFGAAGYYSQLCSDAGLIGLAMSNTCPLVAVTGAATKSIGNNPFSYAAPGQQYRGLLFDVCMSVVAAGKIDIARVEQQKIPFGWLLDGQGNPTDNPELIRQDGTMLPFGGHKGYGFAVMVELFTAVLAGAGLIDEVNSWNKIPGKDANTGHCFLALNPAFFGGEQYVRTRIDQMITKMTGAPKAPGVERIYFPGELEFLREAEAEKHGVPLGEASLQQLRRAAGMTGLHCDWL